VETCIFFQNESKGPSLDQSKKLPFLRIVKEFGAGILRVDDLCPVDRGEFRRGGIVFEKW
jgi:hypothetical protein